ncbi:MAG: hypothetical protein HY287_18035 [Planctomycetes bacterium]|nr:hypothetical protein [Planctomycetota bacterium]MBI3836224.1 hypothetical protein [Planctomycetota bacterium]
MKRRTSSWRAIRNGENHANWAIREQEVSSSFQQTLPDQGRFKIQSIQTCRLILVSVIGVAPAMIVACTEATKYKTLSFFFDGVPPPGSASTANAAAPNNRDDNLGAPAPVATPKRSYPHTPYRDNRCEGCHDVAGGGLVRPIKEGLCLTCHTKLLEGVRYVHGPVAVRDCTVCHEYHASPYPNLLSNDPTTTCLNCHDRSDLSAESHPPTLEQGCVDCHNPHGGTDRFFVKRTQP